jgi:PAS domain S-box-containing protein
MKHKGRVALVTPSEDRRVRASAWAHLLSDRADLEVCISPGEERARDADLVLVDEQCPGLDAWIAESLSGAARHESILVFGSDGESTRGALPWGHDGTPVLAALADLLERRELLQDSEEFTGELRESNHRWDEQRSRFASLALAQAKTMREANVSLSREVEHLRRLQSVARFFAAPGPADSFGDRFACVVGQALGASAAALAFKERGTSRTARARIRKPERKASPATASASRAASVWLPFGERAPGWGLLALSSSAALPPDGVLKEGAQACFSLAVEGFAARLSGEAKDRRHQQNDHALRLLRCGLLKVDHANRVTMANPALAMLLGIPYSHLEGSALPDVFARDPHLLEIFASFRNEASADEIETYLTNVAGTAVPVSIRASIVRDSANDEPSILALLFELSKRKEVESEMRRAERLAALGRLSAGVAHEIRNPLAGIRTTSELLKSRLDPQDDRTRFVEVILEETQRLDRIVASLLQFAKPAEPNPEPVDLAALVDRAIELASGKASELRVFLKRDSASASITPRVDRDQILQVLLNLILNAIEATPPSGEVRVSFAPAATLGKASFVVRIEDGGPGVEAALRERIFDPFFTTKPGGTGLGLSISEHIVRRHGGSIRMEKTDDRAHAAILTLPARSRPADEFPGGKAWPTS